MEALEEKTLYAESEALELCTFPHEAEDYCRVFAVPRMWFSSKMGETTSIGRKLYPGFDKQNWSDTYFLYKDAKTEGIILKEYEVR